METETSVLLISYADDLVKFAVVNIFLRINLNGCFPLLYMPEESINLPSWQKGDVFRHMYIEN